jgi:hypothetical protein
MDFDVGPYQMNSNWISHLGFQNEQNANTKLLLILII